MSVTFYPNYCHYRLFDATAEPSITTQGYTCSGGESTGAAYDLLDNRRTNLITIDTAGEATDFTIDIDLTNDIVSTDFAILDNHNLKTADANFKIRYGASTDYTYISKAYSGPLGSQTTDETVGSGTTVTAPTDGICLVRFDLAHPITNENNYDFSFTDNGGDNYVVDVTVGEIAFGTRFTPTYSPEINAQMGYADGSSMIESDSGQRYGFSKFAARKTWKLSWRYMSAANKTSLQTVFAVTKGMKHPFWIDLGETSPPTLYYVRFMSPRLDFIQQTVNAYSITLDIEEEL